MGTAILPKPCIDACETQAESQHHLVSHRSASSQQLQSSCQKKDSACSSSPGSSGRRPESGQLGQGHLPDLNLWPLPSDSVFPEHPRCAVGEPGAPDPGSRKRCAGACAIAAATCGMRRAAAAQGFAWCTGLPVHECDLHSREFLSLKKSEGMQVCHRRLQADGRIHRQAWAFQRAHCVSDNVSEPGKEEAFAASGLPLAQRCKVGLAPVCS